MCVSFRTKFQISNRILKSFRQEEGGGEMGGGGGEGGSFRVKVKEVVDSTFGRKG